MTNVEDMDTYISSYIVQNRASPFADRDLIIRNPEELNRTRVTTRDSYTLVKYVSLFQKTWTWTDYHQDVRTVAKAFISLGFARYGWIKNQLFKRNPTFLPPDSTVYAYWASMLLNGWSLTLLLFSPEDSLQEFTQPTGRKPVSTFWSRATVRSWWWRTGGSLTRFGRSETSCPISRRYVNFINTLFPSQNYSRFS